MHFTNSLPAREKAMKSKATFLTGIIYLILAACSTQQVQQQTVNQPVPSEANSESDSSAENSWSGSRFNPPSQIIKDNKSLSLVRIMDGGMCKNNFQGARGEFLVYADVKDIERIKREKTPAIFKDFENKIQAFSTRVLQEAIEATNLAEDPFSLGEDEAQQKLAMQLVKNFRLAATPEVKAFQKETTLTIEVTPFTPSFVFYQKGCDMSSLNSES
jgi:hypothetical protein